MTDSESRVSETTAPEVTRPEHVLPAIPRQPGPSQVLPSPQTVPSQVVPSQAALFRERRGPGDDGEDLLLADASDLRAGWQRIKAGFVDNPRGSVAEAANVVEEAIAMLAAALRARQQRIRDSWDSDAPGPDTESLRQAVLAYQSLFRRITDS